MTYINAFHIIEPSFPDHSIASFSIPLKKFILWAKEKKEKYDEIKDLRLKSI